MTEEKFDRRSFWALLSTQFFGAFNDNLFQIAVELLAIKWVADLSKQNQLITVAGIVFALPFLLFSLVAGRLADRFSKRAVMVTVKCFDLVVVALAISGLFFKSIPLLLGGLLLLALQSTFFAPAKYGLLPELMGESELSRANGILNSASFAGILLGTVAGTFYIHDLRIVAAMMCFMAVASLLGSLAIAKVPPANPEQPIVWNPFPDLVANWNLVKDSDALRRSLVAVSFFWFVGGVLHLNTLVYVNNVMHLSERISGVLLIAVVIGIAAGSMLAATLSQEKVELGLVPLGAIGMSLFTIDLYFSHQSLVRTLFDVFCLGGSSGLFVIPLNALIQARSPKQDRGRILATANFFTFVAIIFSSVFLWVTASLLHMNPAQVFLALGIISVGATVVICITIPQAIVRLVLYVLTNTVYRIRVIGRENVPLSGPALLVPNHVSFVDPFLVAGGISRQVRFLMFRALYEKPLLHPFVKLMNAIPVSNQDTPKEIMKSLITARKKLQEGHLVCIFAEGEISRLGSSVLGFKRGLEVILKDLDVPVIPVHLEGVWGSIFSFEGKKFMWKKPRRIPYPVTITFGKPMIRPTSSEIRQRVMDLGSEAFAIHRQNEKTLFESFLAQAKRFPKLVVATDSTGATLNYGQLLVAAHLVGERLRRETKEAERVGILLPPSCAAVIANVSSAAKGLVAINLNYTLSKDALVDICQRAHLSRIITSRKMLEKLAWESDPRFIFIEDLVSTLSTGEKAKTAFLMRALPEKLLRQIYFRRAAGKLDDLATIMFTSGSTGVPKGVMLTQANVLSNLQSISMLLQMDSTDAVLGVLPFFHSFGYTASLWFPLVAGFKAAYHTNPLDSKTIGQLCREQKVTFLMGTPTFISAYIRRIPKEDFASLRFAVAGAEKLRPELAQAFEEKYGIPLLEGYGCTELSPVVALNVPNVLDGDVFQVGRKVGKIGRPIPGVVAKVVDPESWEAKKPGEAGMLLIKGPNVMLGYLDDAEKTSEVIKEGWYVTGDIAQIDEDGFIQITDRLSRFSKIGGEMVPHIMVEEKLHLIGNCNDRAFVVTSVPCDKKGEALAVLVGDYHGDLDDLWKNLNASDMPKLWIPGRERFFKVESLPLLGTGKIDMQSVKETARRLSPTT